MTRPITHSLVKALKRVHGFDRLDGQDLLCIVGASVNLRWPANSHVFTKGSPGEALYVVLSGEVRIYDEVDDREVEIARTGPGDYFGEMSLIEDTTHTKNVQATEDSELLVITKEEFREMLESNPDLAEHVRETFDARRADTESKYQTEAATQP